MVNAALGLLFAGLIILILTPHEAAAGLLILAGAILGLVGLVARHLRN